MGSTFAFPRRKWLCERTTNFFYTYIAFLVINCEGIPVVIYFRDGNRRSNNGFNRDCQSIQSSQPLATKILSKAAWKFAELATKENARSLIKKFVRDTLSLTTLHLKHE